MPIICKDGCYSDRQYFLTVADSGKFRAHIGTSALYYFDSTTSVALNTWYHVAMTYDGAALKLYVNGTLDNSTPVTGNIITTTQPLRIGGSTSGVWGNYKFAGIIDEPTVYSRALLSTEISAIYTAGIAGKCKDNDGDGLADGWETQYFGNLNQNGAGDYDGDGMSNLQEYIMGTSPTSQATADSGQINLQVFPPSK